MPFRSLAPDVLVAGQIRIEDLDEAVALGVRHVISNRPDDEEPGQISADRFAAEAAQRGMNFVHAPARGLPGAETVQTVDAVLATGEPVLLFCKSGMRSAAAWGLASVLSGRLTRQEMLNGAAGAGYDLSGLPLN